MKALPQSEALASLSPSMGGVFSTCMRSAHSPGLKQYIPLQKPGAPEPALSLSKVLGFQTWETTGGFAPTASWVLGPGGEQVTEYSVSSGTSTFAHTNVFAAGSLLATYTGTSTYFAFHDWLGSKRVEIAANSSCASAFVSLPFGNTSNDNSSYSPIALSGYSACADATEHHFTNKERDTESGNDYFGAMERMVGGNTNSRISEILKNDFGTAKLAASLIDLRSLGSRAGQDFFDYFDQVVARDGLDQPAGCAEAFDADNVSASVASGGAKQHVNGRTMAADQRPILNLDVVTRTAALEQQMMIPWCDECAPAQHGIVRLGFFHGDGAQAVKAIGKGAGEQLRHVLHNDNARSVGRECFEHNFQGLCAACRSPNHNYFFSGLVHRMRAAGRMASAVSFG